MLLTVPVPAGVGIAAAVDPEVCAMIGVEVAIEMNLCINECVCGAGLEADEADVEQWLNCQFD